MRKVEAFNEDYNHEPVKVMYGVEIWENDYDYDDNDVTAWVELARDGLQDDLFVGYKLEDAPEYVDIDWETSDNPPTIRGVYIMVESKDLDDLIYDDFNGATQITNDEDASKYLGVSLDEYKEIIEEVKKVALDEMESWAEYYAEREAEYEEPDYDPYDDYDPFMYEELDEGYPPYTHNLVYLPNMNFRGGIDEMIKALDRFDIDALEVKASNFGDVTYEDIREHRREILDKGWDIQPSYDTSIKGANEVFICRKIKKYNESLKEDTDMNKLTESESLQEKQESSNTKKESAKVREAISLITGNLAKRGGYKIEGTKLIIDPEGEKTTFEFSKQVINRLKELGYGEDMNENKQLTEAVDRNKLADFIKDAVEDLRNGGEATHFFDMGADNGLHLVIGRSGDDYIGIKLAVNVDDLQSDFDWDWYMPYDKETGDVWDTEMQIADEEDYDVLAQDFIDEFNKMKDLEIDEDGAIIEHEEVVEESKKDCDDKDGECESCDDKKSLDEAKTPERDLAIVIVKDAINSNADVDIDADTIIMTGNDLDRAAEEIVDALLPKDSISIDESCDKKKSLKEDMSPIQEAVYNYMSADGVVNDDMFDLLCDLVERVDDYNDEDDIRSAIDDGMIYDDDQWTAYRYYCNIGDPEDEMWEELTNDVINICSRLAGNNNDDIEIEGEIVEETVEQPITESAGLKVKDVLDFELEDDDTETGGIPYRGYTVEDFLDEVAFSSDGVTFEFEDDADKDITLESPVEDLNAILVQCGIRPIKK